MKTIAVIDDDIYIGNMLEELLQKHGYEVLRAYSGTEALLLLEQKKADLILLDLMLPGLSGEEVLSRIRNTIGNTPVIVLSAKVDVQDKINVLLSGAADYMTKPFDTGELLARITVQLRKNETRMESDLEAGKIEAGDLCLDKGTHDVKVKESSIHLTKTEYAILKLLMQNPKNVIAKSVILDRISMDTPDCTESSLKQHVSNLRKKLRDAGGKDYIEAVWGIGFRLI